MSPGMEEWRAIPVPSRLAARPRDRRGYIVPASVDDGTDRPDFRRIVPDNAHRLVRSESCWLCGETRDYWMCFIGGPMSMQNRLFNDGWQHEECGLYALSVCPFLSSPNGRYTSSGDDIRTDVVPTRPDRFGLGYTRGFVVDRRLGLLRAAPFKRVRWFDVHGHEIGELTEVV